MYAIEHFQEEGKDFLEKYCVQIIKFTKGFLSLNPTLITAGEFAWNFKTNLANET